MMDLPYVLIKWQISFISANYCRLSTGENGKSIFSNYFTIFTSKCLKLGVGLLFYEFLLSAEQSFSFLF